MFRATPESPRMFDNDLFDFFSRVTWWMVPMIFVPIVAALVTVAVMSGVSWWAMLLQAAAGFVVWTLAEYWLHRTLFHWTPNTSWGPQFHFFLHGVHHDWFNDKLRLVMPPAASLALSVVFFGAYYGLAMALAAVVAPTWVWAFFAGKIVGYMNYDLTHYYIHHGTPRWSWYKKLRAHHNAHHHNPKYKDRKYGVSFLFWDRVFGTM